MSTSTVAGTTSRVSARQAAATAGLALVAMIVLSAFAYGGVIGRLVDRDDPAATAERLTASADLFRAGVLAFFAVLLLDVVVAWGLYILLARRNGELALLAAWFRLLYAALFGAALFNLVEAARMLQTGQLEPDRLAATLDAFEDTWNLGLVSFACHLVLVGAMLLRWPAGPRLVGALVALAGAGYLADGLLTFLAPDRAGLGDLLSAPVAIVGEVTLTVWLLWKPARRPG